MVCSCELSQLTSVLKTSAYVQYEDELAQAQALSVLPLDELQAEATDQAQLCAELGIDTCTDQQAAFGQALLDWFKSRFFTWVRCI